jgi:hypothetical protein
MSLSFDVMAGSMLRENSRYPISNKYKELMVGFHTECRMGQTIVKTKRKEEFPYDLLILLLDHFVKNSDAQIILYWN